MKQKLVKICSEKGLTVASCESLTAGLFTSTIASVPGASAMLKGGFVTYFTEMKHEMAQVDWDLINKYGVVSEQCAYAMATNTRRITNSDFGISFTGNAGPSSMEGKEAGLVYCAIASKEKTEIFEFHLGKMERNELRQYLVDTMIEKLLEYIGE